MIYQKLCYFMKHLKHQNCVFVKYQKLRFYEILQTAFS